MRPKARSLLAVGRQKCIDIFSISQTLLSIKPVTVLVACGQTKHQQGSIIGYLEICEYLIAVIAENPCPQHVSLS